MSEDPNGTRWLKSENNVGRSLLLRGGWTEGSGLGKEKDGVTTHVKVRQKDGTMGIGYAGNVHETWSTQSVAFADVLEKIKAAVSVNDDSDAEGGGSSSQAKNEERSDAGGCGKAAKPSGGRHVGMYAKRHALKTEFLRAKDGKYSEEILGSASSSRKQGRVKDNTVTADDGDDVDNAESKSADSESSRAKRKRRPAQDEKTEEIASTLRSAVLQRLMVRTPKHEPRQVSKGKAEDGDGSVDDDSDSGDGNIVRIVKPYPRPPKCTDTPFIE
ncbi:G-patch domain containing protein [Trypanosoma brucei equiperdum]|uniref:PinX1-related protein 1 n=1 Tax=Trypanosoma brucei equiperdum TaxID=630700 RepID=A0A3L6L4A7_9TRYP|nr:G-patch domain containing protein [Trypanosoma brucei equiperdum]